MPAFVMVPRKAAIMVCATCREVVLGMLAEHLGGGIEEAERASLVFPAAPPPDMAHVPWPCHLCGYDTQSEEADIIPVNKLPC